MTHEENDKTAGHTPSWTDHAAFWVIYIYISKPLSVGISERELITIIMIMKIIIIQKVFHKNPIGRHNYYNFHNLLIKKWRFKRLCKLFKLGWIKIYLIPLIFPSMEVLTLWLKSLFFILKKLKHSFGENHSICMLHPRDCPGCWG